MAKLYFRYAVMNAGKSTQLLQIAYDYEKNNDRKILCLKPKTDTKEGDYIISRLENGEIKRKCDFLIPGDKDWLYDRLVSEINNSSADNPLSIVLIDEAQFLSKENVWDLARIVTEFNIPVICFGIKVDAFGNPFEGSTYLFALAQDIEEVTTRAICRISKKPKKATMNLRLVNGKPVFEGDQVAIENDQDIKYLPVCLDVYMKLKHGQMTLPGQNY
ncbi:MAG TPA: thymidine kinase [Clostridiaceae bacterium]|nr:thymidine kinase [Clostridiaceae bacterium]